MPDHRREAEQEKARCQICGESEDLHRRKLARGWDPSIDNGPNPFPEVCSRFTPPNPKHLPPDEEQIERVLRTAESCRRLDELSPDDIEKWRKDAEALEAVCAALRTHREQLVELRDALAPIRPLNDNHRPEDIRRFHEARDRLDTLIGENE